MTITEPASAKPEVGTIAPVQVVSIWKHPMVLLMAAIAAVPALLAILVQFQELPGLPTNVLAWIGTAIAFLTAVAQIARQLGLLGAPAITPTQAAKLIQTDAK